jgi:hypothetical protein
MTRTTTTEQHLDELAEAVYTADDAWYAALDSVEAKAAYETARKTFRDAERAALDAGATRGCGRCGGSGGWSGWPGFTCFKCGGSGEEPMTARRFQAKPPTRAKREAKAQAEYDAREAAYATALAELGDVGVAIEAASQAEHDAPNWDACSREVHFRASLAHKLFQHGSLSAAQVEAVRRGMVREAEVDAKHAAAGQLTAGKQEISGTIVSHKWQEQESYSGYGTRSVHKMLVELDNGNRVWGTMPAAVDEACWLDEAQTEYEPKGVRVKFAAEVEPSRDDPYFGFFRRPTKAVASRG